MKTFGEWLREQRGLRRLTREEFAQRIGCSASALRKIENGERHPSAQIAGLIANCLDILSEERQTFIQVARGELGVDRLFPGSKSIEAIDLLSPKNNLPVFPTPLIGREHNLEQLRQLLQDPQCRLLTLVGPGGIGKTRLAIETASNMQGLFADGVYLVPLASVNLTRLIVPVIADSIGFTFHSAGQADPKLQLFSYLKEKQLLLLLDNLEQLLAEPGIELLAEVLANAPQVKLLVTSRESLRLQDEWIYDVQGLPVPESFHVEGSVQHTCVELFLQRARRAYVGFNAMPEDYPAIVRICQLTDGNPLGIELAAAWVRTLSCNEIANELGRGLDFLSISARDLPVRHRSMRAVFDHSWKLLSEEQQRVLLQLSTFNGGFGRQAAEQVAEASLSVISSLVTKSLVRRAGKGRFDLHELIRQFAAEQLAQRPEEQAEAKARHGKYYLTFFSQADGRLRSSAQREALGELTVELDNFRAAWDWALSQNHFDLIEQTMRTFWWLYDIRGWFQEGHDMLGHTVDALERASARVRLDRKGWVALGHFLGTRAWFAYQLANYEQAQRMLERSLEILRTQDEPRVLVEAITYLGRVMEVTGDYTKALELYSEGLEISTAIGDRWFAAFCRTLHAALVGIILGTVKPEITHERLQTAVADWREIGDLSLIAFGLDLLSRNAMSLGRYEEARTALEENIALNSSIGFDWGLGSGYRGLGIIEQAQGNHQAAVTMFRRSLDTFTQMGGSWLAARVLAEMGISLLALGKEAEAQRVWRDALRIAIDIQGIPVALEALSGFAYLQAKQGNMEQALDLALTILNHPASLQATKNRCNDLRAELEAQLTPTQIEAIRSLNTLKSFEAVIEDSLK